MSFGAHRQSFQNQFDLVNNLRGIAGEPIEEGLVISASLIWFRTLYQGITKFKSTLIIGIIVLQSEGRSEKRD